MLSLSFLPEKLEESERLEYRAKSLVVDGDLVLQFLRGPSRMRIDLELSARLGKGLLGHGGVKASSEWEKESDQWVSKKFSYESFLWGIRRESRVYLEKGEIDALSVPFALRTQPAYEVGDRIEFRSRDEKQSKTLVIQVIEKKREAHNFLGTIETLRLQPEESEKSREALWKFWVEQKTNLLIRIQVRHLRWGEVEFNLTQRHPQ